MSEQGRDRVILQKNKCHQSRSQADFFVRVLKTIAGNEALIPPRVQQIFEPVPSGCSVDGDPLDDKRSAFAVADARLFNSQRDKP